MVSGLDLVNWQLQLQVPGLTPPDLTSTAAYPPTGWAIEVRINAEDPFRNFGPSSGMLGEVVWPPGEVVPAQQLCCVRMSHPDIPLPECGGREHSLSASSAGTLSCKAVAEYSMCLGERFHPNSDRPVWGSQDGSGSLGRRAKPR